MRNPIRATLSDDAYSANTRAARYLASKSDIEDYPRFVIDGIKSYGERGVVETADLIRQTHGRAPAQADRLYRRVMSGLDEAEQTALYQELTHLAQSETTDEPSSPPPPPPGNNTPDAPAPDTPDEPGEPDEKPDEDSKKKMCGDADTAWKEGVMSALPGLKVIEKIRKLKVPEPTDLFGPLGAIFEIGRAEKANDESEKKLKDLKEDY